MQNARFAGQKTPAVNSFLVYATVAFASAFKRDYFTSRAAIFILVVYIDAYPHEDINALSLLMAI